MGALLRRLPPAAELILVNLICFGPFMATSTWMLLRGGKQQVYDDKRLLTDIGIEIVCGLTAALILRARGWKLSDFGLHVTMPETIWGFVLMFGTELTIITLLLMVETIGGKGLTSSVKIVTNVSALTVLALALINPLYDELFAVAYNTKATETDGAAFAITFSAAMRFFCHLYQGALASVTILPLGLIFAIVYWRWRRLWPLVVAHGIFDVAGYWPEG